MTTFKLKPFVINASDIQFILDQLNFVPLFDAAGTPIVNWDGIGPVYNSHLVVYTDLGSAAANIAAYGTSYQSFTDLAGLRDIAGLNNNLSNATWGATDAIFTRTAAADYANYSPIMQAVADYAYAAAKQYYSSYSTGIAGTTDTFDVNGNLNTDYTISLGGAQHATDGTAITIKNVVDYTPRMISLATTTAGVQYDTWANHVGEPGADQHGANEIYYDAHGVATVLNWGELATVADHGLGQLDTQARLAASAGRDDHFIGGLNPGVSPSNGFFVLFGQFFDHGLDFIDKSSGATIKIALATDDPLYGMAGPDGQPVHEITINRATVQTIDANGPEYVNHTSPYIDQSQTYGSHAQLTTLLREWVSTDGNTTFHAGMNLLDGHTLDTSWTKPDGTVTNQTLPTLNELRAAVVATGRDALTWEDVVNLRNRDDSGHLTTGNSGSALLLDMNPRFDAAHLYSSTGFNDTNHNGILDGTETAYVGFNDANHNGVKDATELTQVEVVDAAIKTLHDYVASSAYQAARPGDTFDMVGGTLSLTLGTALAAGPSTVPAGTYTGANAMMLWVNFADFSIMNTPPGLPVGLAQDIHDAVSDILMASVGDHYIAGDGRVNENFGLTSVHHIFHEEHNFQVQNLINALHMQDIVTNDTNHDKLHDFQIDTGTMNGAGDFTYADGSIAWNEDKVFNGAKLIVEMEYQHAAVDQYARNVSPNIQEFVGYSADKNSAISLEYAQAAFRFGHSTLRETIDTIDPTHGITGKIMGYALKEAFLSPEKFGDIGPASIVLGMTHQQMNEVDEFVTPALNQGLLGQPLDLAAINIARGRDIGMPTLNEFRDAIGLVKYTSWTDFGQNMQHPSSLVNFIAAYAFDGDMTKAQAIVNLVDGTTTASSQAELDHAYAFMNGDEATGGHGALAFNNIDIWLGGLAEVHQPGGILGETFDKVFVNQIESLMDGDRFYYLYRLAGQQFGEEVANGQLKDIVERSTGLQHLNGNIFGYADQYIDLAATKEVVAPGAEALTTGNNHKYGDAVATVNGTTVSVADGTIGVYTNGGLGDLNNGHLITIGGVKYIQDTRIVDPHALNDGVNLDGTPNSGAESSEVIVGTAGNDLIYAQGGDDTVYGDGGNDIIFGGFGIDRLYGGDGSDQIHGGDNPDLIDGGAGDDFLWGDSSGSDINGADQIVGGSGNDFIDGGIGIDKLSAGSGDDKVYGSQDTDPFTHGGDGNDFIDGGSGGDILYGDNGDDIVVGGADQDQLFGGSGDDILRPGDPTGALTIGGDEVLGNDGVDPNDTGFDLIDFSDNTLRPQGITFDLSNQTNPATNVNGSTTQVQSYQIDGVVGSKANDILIGDDATAAGAGSDASIAGNNWLIGGSGNDTITGGGGNDIIIGGSIRLDSLIGKYNTGYTHNNDNFGLTAADQLQDALYQGASHRVLYSETIDNTGLIDAFDALNPASGQFDKHFTEMLRSDQFKNTVLGDGGTDGKADTVVFTGNVADYTIKKLNFMTSNQGLITAYRVVDSVGGRDGTDIVVGVENFKFLDGTLTEVQLPGMAPTITSNGGGDTAAISVAENGIGATTAAATAGANVIGTPALVYSISGGTDAAKFSIDASTGVLTFIAAPNFEAPTDTGFNNVYDVVIKVSDGVAFDTQALAVTVTNVNEAATGSLHIASYVDVGTTASLTAVSSIADPDVPGLVPTTQWQQLTGATWTNVAGAAGLAATLSGLSNGTYREMASYTDPFGSYTIISNETAIVGNNAANTLNGTAGVDILLGLNGNDTLTGNAGNDIVDGGAGNDRFVATSNDGNDSYIGGSGIDVYDLSGTNVGATVNLLAGTSTSTITGNDTLSGIEQVNGSSGGDTITGDANANRFIGGAGDDVIIGGDGNDWFVANSNDGNDIYTGGTGNDSYDLSAISSAVNINLATGTASGSGIGTDTLNGIEQVIGGSGDDIMTGDTFSNSLIGGIGADVLTGGGSADWLTGGTGNDIFKFVALSDSVGSTRDHIVDFTRGQDLIDVATIDAIAGGSDNSFLGTLLIGGGAAFTSAGQLRFYQIDTNGDSILDATMIQGNTDTNFGTIELTIQLDNFLGTLQASDFVL